MTMLDRMRRHKNWLKWSLVHRGRGVRGALHSRVSSRTQRWRRPDGVVASVDGREITVNRFRRAYQRRSTSTGRQRRQHRRAAAAQLGIEQRILQQLIEEEAALAEARRQDIAASDAEVRARIVALPAFQENGQFIGDARYARSSACRTRQSSRTSSRKKSAAASCAEKLQGALTDWITVPDTEIDSEYNRRNEKVKLAYVSLPADKFKEGSSSPTTRSPSTSRRTRRRTGSPRSAR